MEDTSPPCTRIPVLTQISRLRLLRAHSLLSDMQLHPPQYHLFAMLDEKDVPSQAEIASRLMVKPSTLTVMIRMMMKNGLVGRRADPEDRRIRRVFRTEKGSRLLENARLRFTRIERETFDALDEQERACFEALALCIRDNLAKATEGEDCACPWF